jgi:hypothetical protein
MAISFMFSSFGNFGIFFPCFGTMYKEESGNPAAKDKILSATEQQSAAIVRFEVWQNYPKLQEFHICISTANQGCQIFFGTTYQNGEKYTR